MFYRFSCAAVVVFWCVMTGILVNRTYFASEDRLPEVKDVGPLVDLIISNPRSSSLNVYRDLKEVGSIRITPRRRSSGGSQIMMSAVGEMDIGLQGKLDVTWRGEIDLKPNNDVERFNLSVSFRNPRVRITLEFDPSSYEIDYTVEQDGKLVVDSADKDSKVVKRVKALLFPLGLSPGALKRKDARGQSIAPRDAMRVQYGKVTIAGVRQTAYLITLSPTKSNRLKFYFSEVGELLKVGDPDGKPVMGYDILSEGYQFPPGGSTDSDEEGGAP